MMLFLILYLYLYLVISIISHGTIASLIYDDYHNKLLLVVAVVVLLLPMKCFSILYGFDVTIYDVHSNTTTIFHSKIPFEDSI